ncbi:MAG: hypothetical protein ACW981_18665 [Candidatus Hodarchaeales archaeon]|jgi:uncharacterized membrane protein HdeD (DUF308 family)
MVNFSPVRVAFLGIVSILIGLFAMADLIELNNINTAAAGPLFLFFGNVCLISAYFWQFGFSHFRMILNTDKNDEKSVNK